jgi:PadR family transcriptional regulator PadR
MPRRRPAPANAPPEDPGADAHADAPGQSADDTRPGRPNAAEGRTARDARPGAQQPTGWSPRDILIPYVLLAVSLQRAHGYLIEEYLRSAGFFSLEMSTLYRTLRQLEKDGLLLSNWEPGPTGPARRVYSLTNVGRGWLDQWADTLGVYRRMLDQFFGLYGGNTNSSADRPADPSPPHKEL